MSDPDKTICRYFNTLGGCWYGDTCKFLHIPDKRPPCKFFWSSDGCKFGEGCHFSHDNASLKALENLHVKCCEKTQDISKENHDLLTGSGRNNNNITHHPSSRLIISDPPESRCLEKLTKHKPANIDLPQDKELFDLTLDTFSDSAEIKVGERETNLHLTDIPEFTISEVNISSDSTLCADAQIQCGSCKRILERHGNESYCNLLKDHYLECFLDKEGDHVKCVKLKAALEPGQMYWCKSCILIFEKPWSLFQHMADKAKGSKVQRWEKKVHLDWIDSVAGLMAGHDLGLFSPVKLRTDLRNLLADQHTVEEEMEAAAVAAAAMVQWLAPISSPWRLHQREMMRKIENLHRQMLRKAGGAAAIARAALANGPAGQNFGMPFNGHSFSGYQGRFGYQRNPPSRMNDCTSQLHDHSEFGTNTPSRLIIREVKNTVDENVVVNLTETNIAEGDFIFEPLTEEELSEVRCEERVQQTQLTDIISKGNVDVGEHVAGASGDHPPELDSILQEQRVCEDKAPNEAYQSTHLTSVTDSNNTNSAVFSRGDGYLAGSGRQNHSNKFRVEFSRPFDERPTRGFKPNYVNRNRNYGVTSRNFEKPLSKSFSFSQSIKNITGNKPSNNNFDINCGFTDDEVEELFCQGIKPWDSEASAALAVLHGEMDHLLN